MNSESTWLERFYSHYLGRDLTYIFAGGLFICVVEYALYASYFFGSVIRDFIINIFPFLNRNIPDNYPNRLIFYQELIENYDSRILDQYERRINHLAISTSVGSSSLLSGVFMGIVGFYRWFFQTTPSINYIVLAFSLVLLGIFMIYNGKNTAKFMEEDDNVLTKNIISRKERKRSNYNSNAIGRKY